ncbi:MAG: hypothetical protein HXY25_12205 [Alphaproteobacteria bacterium]|nr:hypothetical protein [Alphaproteobacteria bacterium]
MSESPSDHPQGAGTGEPGPARTEETVEKLREAPKALRQSAREAVDEVTEGLRAEAGNAAEQGKRAIAGHFDALAAGLRASADVLKDRDRLISNAAEQAARRVDQASEHIRSQNMSALSHEVSDFARHQPALFLGGSVALGLALSRLARAGQAAGRTRDTDPYTPYADPTGLDETGGGLP